MASEDREAQSVLVADGDILVRHAIADYLRNCGYTVIEATSADEVLTVLRAENLPVHVVLCDAEINGNMTVFELRAWILQHRPGLQIAMAASVEKAAAIAAELCDEGPQLSRPYDPQTVVTHIKRLLGLGSSNRAS